VQPHTESPAAVSLKGKSYLLASILVLFAFRAEQAGLLESVCVSAMSKVELWGWLTTFPGYPIRYVCHRTLSCPKTVLLEAHEALSGKPFLNHSASSQNGDFGQRRLFGQASTRIGLDRWFILCFYSTLKIRKVSFCRTS